MSIFKNILFLQDYPSNARTTDDAARSYANGYGNRAASARAFAPLGHAHGGIERGAIKRDAIASARATRPAQAPRPLEACH